MVWIPAFAGMTDDGVTDDGVGFRLRGNGGGAGVSRFRVQLWRMSLARKEWHLRGDGDRDFACGGSCCCVIVAYSGECVIN